MASSFSINDNNNYFGSVNFGINSLQNSQTNRYLHQENLNSRGENPALRHSDGHIRDLNRETPDQIKNKNKPAVRAFESIRKSDNN